MNITSNKTIIQRQDFNCFIDHPGSVSGFCLTKDNEILLINTKRDNKSSHLEMPGGIIESGEGPINALTREINEEIGYKLISCELIGKYYTSAGITNEHVYIYKCLVEDNIENIKKEFEVVKIDRNRLLELLDKGEIEDFRIKIAVNYMPDNTKNLNNTYSRIISLWSIQESLLQAYRGIFITTHSLLFSISVFIATTEKPYFTFLLFPIGLYLLWFGFRITKKRGYGVWYCILHVHKLDKGIPVDSNGFTLKLHQFMELTTKDKINYFATDEIGKDMLKDRTRRGMDYRVTFFFMFLWVLLLLMIIFIKYLPDMV